MKKYILAIVIALTAVPTSAQCFTCDTGKCWGHCSGACVCFQPDGDDVAGHCIVIEDDNYFSP